MSAFWRNRRVLVTGGTGFLGYHLTKQLLACGAQVRVFGLIPRGENPLNGLTVELQLGDIRDQDAVACAVHSREIVFHAAGPVAVWGPALPIMNAAHRDGTANVLNCVSAGVRVIHTSSIVAVGASRDGKVLDEDSPFDLNIKVDYVHAKIAAEKIALSAAARGRDVVVVNPGYLVGPEDSEPSVMGRLCDRVWKGKMPAAAPGGYNLVDVRDVAAGHLLAAEHGQSGWRYVLGGENHSLAAFIRLLAQAAEMQPLAIPRIPMPAMWVAAMIAELRSLSTKREPYPSVQATRMNRYSWFVRSDRAMRELGYAPRPLAQTVRDTFGWFTRKGQRTMHGFTRWWMRPGQTRLAG